MKEFLIEKFNTFYQDTVDEFQKKLTEPLPSFNEPRADVASTMMWGYTDEGFWYGNNCQVYFFEHTGTIHTVGVLLTPYHYELYNELYKNAPDIVLRPIEIVKEHTLLEYVTNLYYVKFQTPTGKYHRNLVVENLVTQRSTLVESFKQYIDNMVRVSDILKPHGVLPYCNFFNFVYSREESFFMFFENFERYEDRNDGINLLISTIKSYFSADRTFEGVKTDDLVQYTKHKFYIKVLREQLSQKLDSIRLDLPVGIMSAEQKKAILDYTGNLCLPSTI